MGIISVVPNLIEWVKNDPYVVVPTPRFDVTKVKDLAIKLNNPDECMKIKRGVENNLGFPILDRPSLTIMKYTCYESLAYELKKPEICKGVISLGISVDGCMNKVYKELALVQKDEILCLKINAESVELKNELTMGCVAEVGYVKADETVCNIFKDSKKIYECEERIISGRF